MSSVEMGRRGGKQPKQVEGAEVVWQCLIPLLQTTPSPLQFHRLFRNGPCQRDPRQHDPSAGQRWLQLLDAGQQQQKHLSLWSKEL